MKFTKPFILSLSTFYFPLALGAAAATPETIDLREPMIRCWDETFAYGTYFVDKNHSPQPRENGYEIGMSIQFLPEDQKPMRFTRNSDIKADPHAGQTIYFKIPSQYCAEIEYPDGLRGAACDVSSQQIKRDLLVFIPTQGRHLGVQQRMISDLKVERIKFEASPQAAFLQIYGATFERDQPQGQSFNLKGVVCHAEKEGRSGQTHWGLEPFSEEINAFLRKL